MLSLTRKSDYALVALSHMARRNDQLCSAREIASFYRVPVPLLMNILKTLTNHGLVTSVRGSRGGYRLAGPPSSITLQQLVEAIEGPVQLFQCAQADKSGSAGCCKQEPSCPIITPARSVNGRLQEFLSGVTLEEILREPGAIGAPNLRPRKE
jgi:Rrf2 family protein